MINEGILEYQKGTENNEKCEILKIEIEKIKVQK